MFPEDANIYSQELKVWASPCRMINLETEDVNGIRKQTGESAELKSTLVTTPGGPCVLPSTFWLCCCMRSAPLSVYLFCSVGCVSSFVKLYKAFKQRQIKMFR